MVLSFMGLGLLAVVLKELNTSLKKVKLLAQERESSNIELSETNQAYSNFVPNEFLNHLKRDSIIDVKLGDSIQTNMSVMFSDIRAFTSISCYGCDLSYPLGYHAYSQNCGRLSPPLWRRLPSGCVLSHQLARPRQGDRHSR